MTNPQRRTRQERKPLTIVENICGSPGKDGIGWQTAGQTLFCFDFRRLVAVGFGLVRCSCLFVGGCPLRIGFSILVVEPNGLRIIRNGIGPFLLRGVHRTPQIKSLGILGIAADQFIAVGQGFLQVAFRQAYGWPADARD